MVKLLIIADDFTGALDTGVQFAQSGAATRVITSRYWDFSNAAADIDVLVQDAETRHLSPEDAGRVIFDMVRRACSAGIPYLYKKTDSALRGNIGSELAAMLEASGYPRIHFVPAFPRQGRVTVGGIHYIDGTPVANSVFGRDPFEPVCVSDIAQIVAAQTHIPTHKLLQDVRPDPGMEGILIYDAAEDQDLRGIASDLAQSGELRLLAGCAGLAAILPDLLGLHGKTPELPEFDEGLLVSCGSVNPITKKQLAFAAQGGFLRLHLTPRQKLDPGWLESGEGRQTVKEWAALCMERENVIFDTNAPAQETNQAHNLTDRYAAEHGIPLEQVRVAVSGVMGGLVKCLLDSGVQKNLMLTGGDTLLAFMQQVGADVLDPVCELATGVVLSRLTYQGRTYNLLSKSGGLGSERLLPDLAKQMNGVKTHC